MYPYKNVKKKNDYNVPPFHNIIRAKQQFRAISGHFLAYYI